MTMTTMMMMMMAAAAGKEYKSRLCGLVSEVLYILRKKLVQGGELLAIIISAPNNSFRI
jgi:hypothetical protein